MKDEKTPYLHTWFTYYLVFDGGKIVNKLAAIVKVLRIRAAFQKDNSVSTYTLKTLVDFLKTYCVEIIRKKCVIEKNKFYYDLTSDNNNLLNKTALWIGIQQIK